MAGAWARSARIHESRAGAFSAVLATSAAHSSSPSATICLTPPAADCIASAYDTDVLPEVGAIQRRLARRSTAASRIGPGIPVLACTGDPSSPLLCSAFVLQQVQKKKIWEELQPMLLTDNSRVAGFNGVPMLTGAGPVTAATLTAAHIS